MLYAIDLETTGLDYFKDSILGMGYFSLACEKGYLTEIEDIKKWLHEHINDRFTTHNGKFDQQFIFHYTGIWIDISFDTLLAASLLPDRPNRLKLQTIATHYCNYPVWKEEEFVENLKEKPVAEQAAYCLQDCKATYDCTIQLMQLLRQVKQDKFYTEYYMPVANMCSLVEYTGFLVDKGKFTTNQSELIGRISDKRDELYEKYYNSIHSYETNKIEEFKRKNPNTRLSDNRLQQKFKFLFTPQQKIWLLNDHGFKTEHEVKEKGKKVKKQTCSKKLLDTIKTDDPLVSDLVTLQDLITQENYINQYLESAKPDCRIHSNINLHVTDTGRLSSSSPNLQNVSPANKSGFVCQPGYKLVIMDLTAIEPCFMAYYSQDRVLLETFQQGRDLYALVANLLLKLNLEPLNLTKTFMKQHYPKERSFGKTTALAIAYGRGPKRLAEDIKNESGIECRYQDALQYIDLYWRGFNTLNDYRGWLGETTRSKGYLTNIFGRSTFLNQENAEHLSLNYLLQGTASDFNSIFQLWLKKLCRYYQIPFSLVMLVHDEAVYEIEEKYVDKFKELVENLIHTCFSRFMPELNFNVPLGCEIFVGDNWACKQ